MNCEEVGARLSEFYDGELPADLAAMISEHVNACDTCTAELQSFGQIAGLFREQRDLAAARKTGLSLLRDLINKLGDSTSEFLRSSHRLLPLMTASLMPQWRLAFGPRENRLMKTFIAWPRLMCIKR